MNQCLDFYGKHEKEIKKWWKANVEKKKGSAPPIKLCAKLGDFKRQLQEHGIV